jgi:hypothetical protein
MSGQRLDSITSHIPLESDDWVITVVYDAATGPSMRTDRSMWIVARSIRGTLKIIGRVSAK